MSSEMTEIGDMFPNPSSLVDDLVSKLPVSAFNFKLTLSSGQFAAYDNTLVAKERARIDGSVLSKPLIIYAGFEDSEKPSSDSSTSFDPDMYQGARWTRGTFD